jgi:hypothetical protein
LLRKGRRHAAAAWLRISVKRWCSCCSAASHGRSHLFVPFTIHLRNFRAEVSEKVFGCANEPFARGYPAERGSGGARGGRRLTNLARCDSAAPPHGVNAIHSARKNIQAAGIACFCYGLAWAARISRIMAESKIQGAICGDNISAVLSAIRKKFTRLGGQSAIITCPVNTRCSALQYPPRSTSITLLS